MPYQRINYEGAVVQVTDDTARDLIGRGLATPAGAIIAVPAAVIDVPQAVAGDPAVLPGEVLADAPPVAFDTPASEPTAPAKPKGRRK